MIGKGFIVPTINTTLRDTL
nr:DTA toxin [Knock-in vector FBDki]